MPAVPCKRRAESCPDGCSNETTAAQEAAGGAPRADSDGGQQEPGGGSSGHDLQPSGPDPGSPRASGAGRQPGPSASHGEPGPSSQGSGPASDSMAQLQAILGPAVSAAEARRLLFASGSDVQRAVNSFLDGGAAPSGAVTPTGQRGVLSSGAAIPGSAGGKRPASGGAGAKGSGSGSSKRAKASRSPGQRTIQSFFGGSSEATALQAADAEPVPVPVPVPEASAPALERAEATQSPLQQVLEVLRPSGVRAGRQADEAGAPRRDSAALPLDKYDPVQHAIWKSGMPCPAQDEASCQPGRTIHAASNPHWGRVVLQGSPSPTCT